MKKVLLIGALAAMTVAANTQAQVNVTPVANLNGELNITNGLYLKEPIVFTSEDIVGNSVKFTIYANDFSVKKTFTIPNMIRESFSSESVPSLSSLYLEAGYDVDDMELTQYFFNDDDKYEIVRMTRDNSNDAILKVEVVSEDGTTIGELPVELIDQYDRCLFGFSFGEKNYLYANKGDYSGVNIYSIDSSQPGKVSFEKVANQSFAFPNPVRRNNLLTISVADMDLSGESYVEISGLNGQVVHRQPVVSKNGEVVVSTRRLPSGQYIYTVVSNGVSLDTGKLIVK